MQVVVVQRSNGSKTFGVIDKCTSVSPWLQYFARHSILMLNPIFPRVDLMETLLQETVDVLVSPQDNENGAQYQRGGAIKVLPSLFIPLCICFM